MITIKLDSSVDIKEFQRGELPQNAVRIDTESTSTEKLRTAAIMVALYATMIPAMIIKCFMYHTMAFEPLALAGGIIIGVLLLSVHEWLHAAVYPKDANVTMGKLKGKMLFVALGSYPMTRARFVLMCLLPFILGVIPLAVFIFSPAENLVLNGLTWGMAVMGMFSPWRDVNNVITVLKRSQKNDKLMFYEDGLYRIGE